MATERDDTTRLPGPPATPAASDSTEPVGDHWPSAEELRKVSHDVSALYPPPRLGTELVLLEVSPHRAHAYWNVDVEDFQAARRSSGMEHPPMVMRLYDVTGVTFDGRNAHTAFDIEIQGLQGHWYVDLWKDGRTHVAEIGFRRVDGTLACMARSNPVSTPPASESAEYSTLAVDTGRSGAPELRITDLIGDPNLSPQNLDTETGSPVESAPGADYVVTPPAAPFVPPDHVPDTEAPRTVPLVPSSAPVSLEFPRPPAPAPGELQAEVRAYFDQVTEAAASAPAAQPWQGPGALAPSAAARPAGAPEGREGAPTDATEPDGWPSAEELARHVPDTSGTAPVDLPAAPGAGAQGAPAEEPAPAAPTPLPLDSYVNLSSFEHGRREVALEVNVELHIHGRARPGTELSLYGQPVILRPDGTFSIRKPLPQGAVVLPLLAVDPPPQKGV